MFRLQGIFYGDSRILAPPFRKKQVTLPETNCTFAPENKLRTQKGELSSSKHPFSKALVVRFRKSNVLLMVHQFPFFGFLE